MTANWDEIKQLALDFQRTQLSENIKKLSERNCIEIVNKLIKQNLLELIFTTDGKEYLTPSHLLTEIENELYANNGRIYLHELSSVLQVDINLIEQKVSEVVKNSKGRIFLILNQLITSEYKDLLAIDINLKLQTKGSISVAEIVKFCDLPPDFILNLILSKLKTSIDGIQDPNDFQNFFTKSYLDQYKSKITGILNAITKPTQINQIVNYYKIPQKIFNNLIHDLLKSKIKGSLTSNINGLYIPNIYSKLQIEWIENFIKNNKYLEFDVLYKIGITDPKSLYKKNNNIIFLKTCLIETSLFNCITLEIEDIIQEESWIDLYTLTPSVLNNEDFSKLYEEFIKRNKKYSESLILHNNYLISNKFINKLINLFNIDMKEKANEDLKNEVLSKYFKNNQVKDNSKNIEQVTVKKKNEHKQNTLKQKSGGGTQGREIKMKSTKKKYHTKNDFSDDESDNKNKSFDNSSNVLNLQFAELKYIKEKLIKENIFTNGASDDLIDKIARKLLLLLNPMYLDLAKKLYYESQTITSFEKKKAHTCMQNSIITLYTNIFVYNKGLLCVSDDLKVNLTKYLCKTLCTEIITNMIIYCLEEDQNLNLNTFEARTKIIKTLDEQYINDFNKLNLSLNQNQIESFLDDLKDLLNKLNIKISKIDKRRENNILLNIKQNLIKQLDEINEDDFALILHLSVLLIFSEVHKQLIHASGKFVPQIINHLKTKLNSNTFDLLFKCEQLIVTLFRKEISEENKKNTVDNLKMIINDVKNLAITLPKHIFVDNEKN